MNNFNQTEVYKLHQLVFCLDNSAQKALISSTKITYIQFLILLSISENPNFGIQQIGNWVNLTKSAVSQQVDKLVKINFVIRRENPKDRREKSLEITDLGLNELNLAKVICNKVSENLFEVLNTSERITLQKILDQLINKGFSNMYKNLKA